VDGGNSRFTTLYLRSLSHTGIFTLGEKLGMDATEDIRVLVLLWKMNCCRGEKPAQITQQEWMSGCSQLQIDSWSKLQKLIPSLDTGFLDQIEFKDFYKFCFQFNRQGTHRTLDKELVIDLLPMVLHNRIPIDRITTFCEFLQSPQVMAEQQYTRITLDQWTSFLDFCVECGNDLSTYDESTSAWPVILDEYVEYMESKHQQQQPSK
jgi:hypothetical protein